MTLIDGVGLFCEIFSGDCAGRAAIFLDRDGTIVENVDYLGRAADVRMLPGAAQAIGRCNELRIPIVLVTNQSGVGRGYYDWNGFREVQSAVNAALARNGAHIDAVLACAYHPEANGKYRVDNHHWRKPNPGMIAAAVERMGIDPATSWIIGDRAGDLAAGRAAVLRGGVLVAASGERNERAAALALAGEQFIVRITWTLADAVDVPIGHLISRWP